MNLSIINYFQTYCAAVDMPAMIQNLGDMLEMPGTAFSISPEQVQAETRGFYSKMQTIINYFNVDAEVFFFDGKLCGTISKNVICYFNLHRISL